MPENKDDHKVEHKTEHKEKRDEVKTVSSMNSGRGNPWVISTIILFIVVVALLIVMLMKGGSSGSTITSDEAGKLLVSFVSAQTNGNITAVVVSSVQEGPLYKVTLSMQGQTIPVYVTNDGKYLITQPIPLAAGNGSSANNQAQNNQNTAQTTPSPNVKVNISIGNSPKIGSKNASVTVVEFSDFSCPYCAAASGYNQQYLQYMQQNSPDWQPIVVNLMKDYVSTGKVLFVTKYTMGHTGGHPAQLVAWCLNEQNLYWKFYPAAYANQTDVEDLTKMKALAKTIGADMTKLQSCLDSNKYNSQFDTEQNEGVQAGVSGTPAFFVNGQLVEGAVPYSQIKALIDADLNNQNTS